MADIPPLQDLLCLTDFTQFNSWSGSLFNTALGSLQGNSAPDSQSGISFGIWTIDPAVGAPNAPNPFSSTPANKWQNYFWIRIPNPADSLSQPIIYIWDFNSEITDPPFYKWVSIAFDDSTIENQIANLTTQVTTALNAANTANSNSSNALNIANSANTTAINAANSVAGATSLANQANTAAASANALATQANSIATAALATANSAISQATQNKNITQINPGTAGQRIRVNDAATSLEYFNTTNTLVILTEQVTTSAAPSSSGTRQVNTKLFDNGNLCTNIAGGLFTLAKGVYRVRATVPMIGTGTGGHGINSYATLYNNTSSSAIVQSDTYINGLGVVTGICNISGIITTDGTQQYSIVGNSGITPDGSTRAGVLNYTIVELEKVG